MFEPIVRAIIKNEKGDVLLVKRAKEPAKDKYTLPGGKVEFHETSEAAIIREVKEELDIDFIPRFLGYNEDFASVPSNHVIVFYFIGNFQGKILPKKDEISGHKFFTPAELKESEQIGFNHKDILMTFLFQKGVSSFLQNPLPQSPQK